MSRVLAALVLLGLLLVGAPASASCAEVGRPAIAQQPVVLVGSALEERRGHTRFAVDSVLVGPDLAPEVWVRSSQVPPPWWSFGDTTAASSVDVTFEVGRPYVVGADRSFGTYSCIVAPVDETDDVRRVDPAALGTRRPPTVDGLAGADPPAGPLEHAAVVLGGVAALLAAGVLLVRRAGRPRRLQSPGPALQPHLRGERPRLAALEARRPCETWTFVTAPVRKALRRVARPSLLPSQPGPLPRSQSDLLRGRDPGMLSPGNELG